MGNPRAGGKPRGASANLLAFAFLDTARTAPKTAPMHLPASLRRRAIVALVIASMAAAVCACDDGETGACVASPSGMVRAGDPIAWRIVCRLPGDLDRRDGRVLALFPPLRDGDRAWTTPEVFRDPSAPGAPFAVVGRSVVEARPLDLPRTTGAAAVAAPRRGWRDGQRVEIVVGRGPDGGPASRAPTVATPSYAPTVVIETRGGFRALRVDGGVEVRAGAPERAEVVAPSAVETGRPFSAIVRFTDRWGNTAIPREPVRVTFKERSDVGRDLSFTPPRSAVVERGATEIPAGSFDLAGYRWIVADFRGTLPEAMSNPIAVGAAGSGRQIVFGDLDLATARDEGTAESIDAATRARDERGLGFVAFGDRSTALGSEDWTTMGRACEALETAGRFTTLLGLRRDDGFSGLVIHDGCKAREPLTEGDDALARRYPSLKPLSAGLAERDWGPATWLRDGDRRAVNVTDVGPRALFDPGVTRTNIRKAWALAPDALRAAAEAVSMADAAIAESAAGGAVGGVVGGDGALTAVPAGALTRRTVFDALKNGRAYATTGARILVYADVDGKPPGRPYTPGRAPVFSLEAAGTAPVERVELVKNGVVLFGEKFDPPRWTVDVRTGDESFNEPAVYHWRVEQEDGHAALVGPFDLRNPDFASALSMTAAARIDAVEVSIDMLGGESTTGVRLFRRVGDDGGWSLERYERITDDLPNTLVFRDDPLFGIGESAHYLLIEERADERRVIGKAVGLTRYPARHLEGASWQIGGRCGDAGPVRFDIVDRVGAPVRAIDLGEREAGLIDVVWDGRDTSGGEHIGAAFYRVRCGDFSGPLTPVIDLGAPPTPEAPAQGGESNGLPEDEGEVDAANTRALSLAALTSLFTMRPAHADEPTPAPSPDEDSSPIETPSPRAAARITLPDPMIRANLAEAMAATRSVRGHEVSMEVKDGVVRVTGRVDTIAERNLVIAVARTSPGVKRVRPNLVVKPEPRKPWPAHDARDLGDVARDEKLLASVKRAVAASGLARTSDMDIQVYMGVAILSGPVRDEAARARLRERVLYLEEVRAVVNNMWIEE